MKPPSKKSVTGLIEYTEKMIAALSHELRNPLNSMKGAAEFLHDKYEENSEVREFSGIILDEINRVDAYLNEFLSFSRGMKLKIRQVNLKNFITGILMTLKHRFPYEIRADVNSADTDIQLDNEQMRSVLVNLLSNARDAVNAARRDNPEVRVTVRVRAGKAYISVIDNGTGIKKNVLKNIFVPFYTTRDDGMGIGLTICRTTIQRHGGRLNVKSSPGKGSVFTVELPLKRRKE